MHYVCESRPICFLYTGSLTAVFLLTQLLFSCQVVSNSLWPHWVQHARPPFPSPSPGVCPSSYSFHQMPSSYLIIWCPLILLTSIFPSIRDFSSESSVCIRWPEYWSFSFSISASSEYSGLIFLNIDWFDLAVHWTLRSHHQNLKASILWCSAFFMVQLSQPYVITEKTIALTMQTLIGRVMSLFFNTLSRFATVVWQLIVPWL